MKIGSHQGGYDPFYFDITELIEGNGQQLLEVRVSDPVDKGPQPRGKQVLKPGGICILQSLESGRLYGLKQFRHHIFRQ